MTKDKKKAVHYFAPIAILAGTILQAQTAAVVASDAWVRLPAPSKSETALYLVLENRSTQQKSVVSATSPQAEKAEFHEMKMIQSEKKSMPGMDKSKDAMMAMTPVSQISIPAQGKTALQPNGLHIMLFGLKSKLKEGDKVSVTLKLSDGGSVPVTAVVRQ